MASIRGWFRPSAEVQRVYARSPIFLKAMHYVEGIGHAQCIGPGCVLCADAPPARHGVCVVQSGALRELHLLELRPRHAQTLDEALALGEDLVGTPIFVWRDQIEHGRPIEISFEKPEDCPRSLSAHRVQLKTVPAERYVAQIGTREYLKALMARPDVECVA